MSPSPFSRARSGCWRTSWADVSLVRLPVDRTGLKLVPLFSEPLLVALPTDHRLAGKEAVRIADLAGEHLLQNPAAVPEWPEKHRPNPTIRTVEESWSTSPPATASWSTTTFYRRPDVTCVPVDDIGSSEVRLARDATRRSRLIAEFAALLRDRPDTP